MRLLLTTGAVGAGTTGGGTAQICAMPDSPGFASGIEEQVASCPPRRPVPLTPESECASPRAYVVKVRSDAQPDALSGRLENFVTGQCHEFASSDELLKLIADDLAAIVEAKPRAIARP